MAPVMTRREALIIVVVCFVSQSGAIITRRVDQEIPSSILTTPSCNGSFTANRFQNMIVHNDSVYVGATNTILQLSQSLSLTNTFLSGPDNDSVECKSPTWCPEGGDRDLCVSSLRCNNNYNRVLLSYRNQLLACGTLYEVCVLLQLDNISNPIGSPDSLQCKSENVNQFIHVSSRNLGQNVVAAVNEDTKQRDSDLLYLGQHGKFIQTLIAPSRDYPYFTLTDELDGGSRALYHYVWTTPKYGYVLWTNSSTSEVKLSRYCNKAIREVPRSEISLEFGSDSTAGIRTYTEITIRCPGANLASLNVESARFQFDQLFIHFNVKNHSAICTANLTALNEHFNFVRKECFFSHSGDAYAKHFLSNCSQIIDSPDPEWSTCAVPLEFFRFLTQDLTVVGLNPFLMNTFATLSVPSMDSVSSFVIDRTNGLDAVFLGTITGNILKVRVRSNSSIVSERIESNATSPILKGMVIDNGELFAISSDKIVKVRVANCEQYRTCSTCMESLDPYCGWCIQQSRCTRTESCPSVSDVQNWIGPSLNSNSCPRVSAITPNIISIQINGPTWINLEFSGVPLQSSLLYSCNFITSGNLQLPSSSPLDFNRTNMVGTCVFPELSKDDIGDYSEFEVFTVSVTHNGVDLASGTLRVYSCPKVKQLNYYTMCSSCVSSEWGCTWCASSGTCNSPYWCSQQSISNASSCPKVMGFSGNVSDVAVGEMTNFYLEISSVHQLSTPYQCQYNFCGKTVSSAAYINQLSMIAECTAPAGSLTCDESSAAIEVFLKGNDYVIDTPLRRSVTAKLYNCSSEEISGTCAQCIAFRRECSDCVWCPSLNKCTTKASCSRDAVLEISGCGTPSIDSVSPLSSPFNGGTKVTIVGRNLGSNINEISNVRTGSVPCTVVKDLYVPSERIVCITGVAESKSDSGPVVIATTYGNSTQFSRNFEFRIVNAYRYNPRTVLNQTSVTIEGRNLNVGNEAFISFSDDRGSNSSCTERKENSMICPLPPATDFGEYFLSMMIDNFSTTLRNKVEIVAIPSLIDPKSVVAFNSAGGSISLQFSTLKGVHNVALQVGSSPSQKCILQPQNATVSCRVSPRVPQSRKRRQAATGDASEAALILNGVHRISLGPVTYHPNPQLSALKVLPCHSTTKSSGTNGTKNQKQSLTKTIQIPGKNFDLTNPAKSDYSVLLRPEKSDVRIVCNVTFIEDTSLFCRAWSSQLSAYVNRKITIHVSIGSLNMTRVDVDYCVEDNTAIFAIAIAIPIVIVLLIVIVVLLLRQRRRVIRQARERSLILKKLDDLENKTREQARNAYFELQVGYMNNLSDNITRRITYRPAELYFIQTLFNLAGEHPVLDRGALRQETPKYDAIKEWMKLLKNREFLMTFIRTLEEQKKFTIQEKGNVASLLVVSLFDDMPYFTNIMFELLTELIQKHVHKNPKLLLRRSESVVEKMVSHWLSINLYDECILGRTGEPLFLLTKAIHYLVSSAPCDVIADKSVNSLNESTLLSSEVSYNTTLLLASMQEENGNVTKSVEVTVVDVDSITQAKQKIIDEIYKDRPYSECPKPDELELELHTCNGNGEGVTLSDIDGTSEKHRSYTKINTLKHYNVDDKSRVILRHLGTSRPASPDPTEPLLNGNGKSNHIYHLIHPRDDEISNGYGDVESSGEKRADALLEGMINRPFQEIYLTRMVRSKTTLQEYVDGVFKAILCPDPIPQPVRYFFQFLDREAIRHGITDAEVVHIWKTNSLLLRYWVNILKNPEFLFDVNKTPIIDSCLSVITQAFMDACATSARKLGQDSPSNKLLYAKDSEHYKTMVNDFFKQISNTTWIREEDIDQTLKRISQLYSHRFNSRVACQQLYQYLFKYKDQVISAIRRDDDEDLAQRVEKLARVMEGKHDVSTTVV